MASLRCAPTNRLHWPFLILIVLSTNCYNTYGEGLSEQEIAGCEALIQAVPQPAQLDISASDCCLYFSPPRTNLITVKCDANNSFVEEIHLAADTERTRISLNFDEFFFFTNLKRLKIDMPLAECLPRNLHRFQMLEELHISGEDCLFPDSYFANFTSPLRTLKIVSKRSPPPRAVAALAQTLSDFTFSYPESNYYPPFLVPSEWYSLNLSSIELTYINTTAANLNDWLVNNPLLTKLSLKLVFNDQRNILLRPIPSVESLSITVTGRNTIDTSMLNDFAHLRSLYLSGDVSEFPQEAFSVLPFVTDITLDSVRYPPPLILDNWNASNLESLTIVNTPISFPFPPSMKNLRALKILTVVGSNIVSFPSDLSTIFLDTLYLWTVRPANGSHAFGGLVTLRGIDEAQLMDLSSYSWVDAAPPMTSLFLYHTMAGFLLPQNIGNIPGLRSLQIVADFAGELPISMSNLTQLRTLSITAASRGFTFFPSWLTNMTSLEVASFHGLPAVRGGFPDLSLFPSLRELSFDSVGIDRLPNPSGSPTIKKLKYSYLPNIASFPDDIEWCPGSLDELELTGLSQLRVPVPNGIFSCLLLRSLSIDSVPFTGPLPSFIDNLGTLRSLKLQSLNINGTVPDTIVNIAGLRRVELRDMPSLSGHFPAPATGWADMETLTIVNTRISSISPLLSSSPFLQHIEITSNYFSAFPEALSRMPGLLNLIYGANRTPRQPFPDLSGLSQLRSLTVYDEQFDGIFPTSLSRLSNITQVSIINTLITGAPTAALFARLSLLELRQNPLGALPLSIPQNCTLRSLTVSQAALNGDIPLGFASCSRLQTVDLSRNALGPAVPAFLWQNLTSLAVLRLNNNNFSSIAAPAPLSIPSTRQPEIVELQNNILNGSISEGLIVLILRAGMKWNMSSNFLECPRFNFSSYLGMWDRRRFAVSSFPACYVDLSRNLLGLSNGSLACPSLVFGPEIPDAPFSMWGTIRLPVKPLPWACAGAQPTPNTPCVAPGVWLVAQSLTAQPEIVVRFTANTTIQGNFSLPAGTRVSIVAGSVVTVQGCADLAGNLLLDISNATVAVNQSLEVLNFDFLCNSSTQSTPQIDVIGAPNDPCTSVTAREQLSSRSLAVLFEIQPIPNCGRSEPSVTTFADTSASNIGIAAGVVSAVVLVIIIVAIVLIYKFKDRLLPSNDRNRRLRARRSRQNPKVERPSQSST